MALLDEPSKQPLPSTPTLEDHRFALVKGGISALPLVGGALAEEMGLLLIAPLTRRRDEWWADVARRVLELESKVQSLCVRLRGDSGYGGHKAFEHHWIRAAA